jgi:hypothetical protein
VPRNLFTSTYLRETVNIFEKTGLIWGTIAPKRDCFDLEKRLSGRAKLFVPSDRACDFICLKPLSRENLRFLGGTPLPREQVRQRAAGRRIHWAKSATVSFATNFVGLSRTKGQRYFC